MSTSLQNKKIEEQQNPFDDYLPSSNKLANIVLALTFAGLIIFPILAVIVSEAVAIHMWVLLALDAGLFFSCLYMKRFLQSPNDNQEGVNKQQKQEGEIEYNNKKSKKNSKKSQ